ncbi:MAG: UbiD family decarboxylase [Chloroflexi bacterium]|nr:UbiD family decarboxylase [Chloroflexota bacterium]
MAQRDITSLRSTLEFLKQTGEVLAIPGEVDPVYEIAGIEKALDNGPALLFEKIKGFPHARVTGNVCARKDRVARIFGLDDARKLKFEALKAIKNPAPPKVVGAAPCQEVVVTEGIDVPGTVPITKHSEADAGRVLGGGNNLLYGKYFGGGSHISFNRTHFRGKDWASIFTPDNEHIGKSLKGHLGGKVPMTINIGTPPAIMVVAAGGAIHTIIPVGSDELGIAGALQGSPIEIVKAKTVDAYSIAQSEWVIEGYIDTNQRVWETEEAEKIGKPSMAKLFPEWPGYMGLATQTYKFQVTAITHRKDRPIFFAPLARSFEHNILCPIIREACIYELADRLVPGLVTDVNTLNDIAAWSSIILQVKKRGEEDEGYQRQILQAIMGTVLHLRLAVIVDEDVDIYSPEDVLWAILSRLDLATGAIVSAGGKKTGLTPTGRFDSSGNVRESNVVYKEGVALDATAPFKARAGYERAKYPVDRVELTKWLSADQVRAVRAMQSDYARILAETGR